VKVIRLPNAPKNNEPDETYYVVSHTELQDLFFAGVYVESAEEADAALELCLTRPVPEWAQCFAGPVEKDGPWQMKPLLKEQEK
jgi:hypothetical protein